MVMRRRRTWGTANVVRRRTRGRPLVMRRRRRVRNRRTGGYVGRELKFLRSETVGDTFATGWATMEDGTMKCLNAVSQGNGESARVGRRYTMQSIHVRGLISEPKAEAAGDPIEDTVVRIVMVLDKQTNAAQMTASNVYDITAPTVDYLAFRNLQYTARFQVLWDRTFVLKASMATTNEGAAGAFACGVVKRVFKINHVFKGGLKVECVLTAATVASITDNSIHMIGIASNASVQMNWQSRLRFTG